MSLRFGAHLKNPWKACWRTALLEGVLRWQAIRRRSRNRGSAVGRLLLGRFALLECGLIGLLQPLLLLFAIVRIDATGGVAAARLRLRLERLPDHRRQGIVVRREDAVHRLAGGPVDSNPADSGRC